MGKHPITYAGAAPIGCNPTQQKRNNAPRVPAYSMGRQWVSTCIGIRQNKKQSTFAPMQNDWLTISDAAIFVGRSISTLRRILNDVPAAHIRREPIPGKGGERIFLERAYLLERYPTHTQNEPHATTTTTAGNLEILERQLIAKDAQISHLQRDGENKTRQLEMAQQHIADLTNNVQQLAAVNAGLQNRMLLLVERVEDHRAPGAAPPTPWYMVSLAVVFSLIAGLLLYLLIQWVGNG